MVAIIGIPGSSHHHWERFWKKADAREWLEDRRSALEKNHPAVMLIPLRVLSEKEAAKCRYRDGSKCYPTDRDGDGCYG